MKTTGVVISCAAIIISLLGCATLKKIAQPTDQADTMAARASLPSYSGPKARIAVADFEMKAAKATAEIGLGLREILVTTLVNSNRFSVMERQVLSAIMQEQGLSTLGNAELGGVIKGEVKAADLIIAAVVTEFEPQASGGTGGVGGGGGASSGILGGLLGVALDKAHLALDIRIIDTSTSEILAATRVQGEASDVSGTFTGLFAKQGLGTGLSVYANTPMEKAIRICIIEAVRYISKNISPVYYKY